MPAATVCVECFADEFLRDLIRREGNSSDDGNECYHCGAVGERCLKAEKLASRFSVVVQRIFKADPDMEFVPQEGTGETIGDLLRDSTGTLNPDMDEPDALVRAVLERYWTNRHKHDDFPSLDDTWILPEDDWGADSYVHALDTLSKEVLALGHALHLGPGKPVAVDARNAAHAYGVIQGGLGVTAVPLEQGTTLYRARLDLDKAHRAEVDQFLAPPVMLAKAARANVQGERVWYLARERRTALAEVRPGIASEVSVAEFVLRRQLRLCGLDRRLLTSPFEDLEKYVREKEIARVAADVGWMFARPVRPSDIDTDYLITQLLARMIREAGFDGAAYPSSQATKGLNYVLFDPTLPCDFGSVQTFFCKDLEYAWTDVHDDNVPHEEVNAPLADVGTR